MASRFWALRPPVCGTGQLLCDPDNFYNAYGCYPQIPHDNPGTYYSTLPYGPTATEDGLVWLNTGSGPALKGGNLAVSIYYENTSSAWQLEETDVHERRILRLFYGHGQSDLGQRRASSPIL